MNLTSFPLEWAACLIVAGLALFCGGKRRMVAGVLATAAVLAAWIFGTTGMLLIPLGLAVLPLLMKGKARLFALAGAAVTAALCWLFPLPQGPSLSGPHAVGTFAMEVPAEGEGPRLLAQVWYPADPVESVPRVPWLPDPAVAPSAPLHRIVHALAHAQAGLPVIKTPARLPVIFYEHGWMGHRAENVAQVEELASQGFVVVAIEHPGQALRVKYADGSIAMGTLPPGPDLSTSETTAAFEGAAEKQMDERMVQVERIRSALSTDLARDLRGRLNLDAMGAFGFSFGGSTAVRLCSSDPHFIAGADEDGFFLGGDLPRGPFLFFDDDMPSWLLAPPAADEAPWQALTRRSEKRIQTAMAQPLRKRVILGAATHASFTDRIFLCRYPRLAKAGKRPAAEIHATVAGNLGDFFRQNLAEKITGAE